MCLFIISRIKMMIDLMLDILFPFYSADICSFHPWPGHWEARGERAVSSFYWSQVWLLLSAQLSCSGCITHHTSALGDTEWPSPGHRPCSLPQHTQSSAERPQILIQGIHQNMQSKLALCICIHHSYTYVHCLIHAYVFVFSVYFTGRSNIWTVYI